MNIINKLLAIGNGKQIANSFDKATLVKIGKGALIAGTGAAALFILDAVGSIEFTNPNITTLVAFSVPFLVNMVKEYMRGK